jgi:hypothetical protein
MTASHLRLERADDVVGGECSALLGEDDLECDVEEEIAELAGQLGIVAGGYGIGGFVSLLEQVRQQGIRRLSGIPLAMSAEEPDEAEGAVQGASGRVDVG